jgi:hypothetical protein
MGGSGGPGRKGDCLTSTNGDCLTIDPVANWILLTTLG